MIYIDFETRSEIDLRKCGAWNYSLHPSTEVHCMAYRLDNRPVKIWIPEFDNSYHNQCPYDLKVWLFGKEGQRVEAHNAFFEYCIWDHIMVPRYRWPRIDSNRFRCSMAKALSYALPRSLEGATEALDSKYKKDPVGRRIMLKMCKPRKPTEHNKNKYHADPKDFELLYEYCKKDVMAEKALSESLKELPSKELKIWQMDQRINRRGVYCDIDAVKGALIVLTDLDKKAKKEILELTDGEIYSYGQIAAILDYCESNGFKLKSLDKDSVKKALKKELPFNVKRILEIRQSMSKSSTKKYQAMLNLACKDSRIRSTLVYHGASTGRWAGSGIQPQNYTKGKIKDPKEIKLAIECLKSTYTLKDPDQFYLYFDNPMSVLSSCLRAMLCAAPNHVLIGADYSSIEARVLLWLADDKRGLELFRNGADIYKDMAATIYNIAIEKVTKEQREMGKRAILGLGYQMGRPKFKKTCYDWGKQVVSNEFAQRVVDTYRDKYKKVVKLWSAMNRAAIICIKTGKTATCGKVKFKKGKRFLYCQLPSGRKLAYYNPKLEIGKYGKAQIKYWGVDSQSKKWNRQTTYGGKLVENMTQAVARDIMAHAMLRVEKKGYPIVLSVHDEIVSEVKKNFGSIEEFENLLCKLPQWAKGLPVAADGWKGKRFKK